MAEAKLYIIATPLGNIRDITLRAVETLKNVSRLFAEDSRELSKLLELHGIAPGSKRIHSYASHNMKEATEKAIQCLKQGEEVGFCSDRGTPAISDPGALLVRRAWEEGFPVVPLPGPSSVTALLSVSGWDCDRFAFLGFLPSAQGERFEMYDRVQAIGWPTCFFESPKRIRKTVEELKARFPEGELFVGREMTKIYETFQHLSLTTLDPESMMEKGEYALVLAPGAPPKVAEEAWREELRLRLAPEKEWAKALAERFELSSKDVYNALQDLKRDKM